MGMGDDVVMLIDEVSYESLSSSVYASGWSA